MAGDGRSEAISRVKPCSQGLLRRFTARKGAFGVKVEMMPRAQIMIVEDEMIVARSIKNGLESLGYHVPAIASSGAEAIQKIGETSPDLVLMDIVLQGDMDGVKTAEHIRSHLNIPVIYLTAYSDEATLQRAKLTEPFGYILKPFVEDDLHTAIEMALYKHQMENRLKENEQWLTTILRSIGDAVITTDHTGVVTFLNPVAEALIGQKRKDALGKELAAVFKIIDAERGVPIENFARPALQDGMMVALPDPTMLVGNDGTKTPIDDSLAPIRDDQGNITGAVLIFRDITERRRAEEARRNRDQLQAFSRRQIEVQEAERRRIARELHDEIGQALTGLGLILERVKRSPARAMKVRVEEGQALVHELMRRVRDLSRELRPAMLDDLGLLPALLWLFERYSKQTNVHVSFAQQGLEERFVSEVETAVYRIVQEALTNVARHAGVEQVSVSVRQEQDTLQVRIEDQGIGFDPQVALAMGDTSGLVGMQERALLLGGQLAVRSTPGAGTCVTAALPLPDDRLR